MGNKNSNNSRITNCVIIIVYKVWQYVANPVQSVVQEKNLYVVNNFVRV